MNFNVTNTAKCALRKQPALPGWSAMKFDVSDAKETIRTMEADKIRHKYFSNIYGMVKLIDDNIGKLFTHLEERGVAENTIIVFTSDHGDQLGKLSSKHQGCH